MVVLIAGAIAVKWGDIVYYARRLAGTWELVEVTVDGEARDLPFKEMVTITRDGRYTQKAKYHKRVRDVVLKLSPHAAVDSQRFLVKEWTLKAVLADYDIELNGSDEYALRITGTGYEMRSIYRRISPTPDEPGS